MKELLLQIKPARDDSSAIKVKFHLYYEKRGLNIPHWSRKELKKLHPAYNVLRAYRFQSLSPLLSMVLVPIDSRVANCTGSASYAYNFICSGSSHARVCGQRYFLLIIYSLRLFFALNLAGLMSVMQRINLS